MPRGTYRAEVIATNGVQGATQRASVLADAFKITVSDSTPRSRPEDHGHGRDARDARQRLARQGLPAGDRRWSVATTKVSSTTYRVTLTMRSSSTGTVRIKAYGKDTNGQSQSASIYLPLH